MTGFALSYSFFAACLLTGETALDRYVATPDSSYGWKLEKTMPGPGATTFVLKLTSQTWRSAADVDRPIWTHWLTIVRPEKVTSSTGFLFIGGGENGDPPPEKPSDRVAALAVGSGTIVAELGQVPNQPLIFTDSKDEGRVEDNIIAYTRVKYMATRDETWLVRLAMVKSAVRALDAMQEFAASKEGGGIKLDKFVVAGGSKRGWTTWLTAVVDPRVVAIVPIVIDALNSEKITRHHYEAYGFFSKALDDYVRHGLFPHKVGTPEYREILAIEDPYNYRQRDRLKIPKFIVNASGDEFFLPDNSQFYFDELSEPKWLRYVPNAKHSLEGSDALESVAAFYQSVVERRPRPTMTWKLDGDELVVNTSAKPMSAKLWRAENPNARDFRLDVIGPAYQATAMKEVSPTEHRATLNAPEQGFAACFAELAFPSGGRFPFKFTTRVYVLPDVLPYKFEDALKAKKQELK